jgi:uncharacterized protein YqeY
MTLAEQINEGIKLAMKAKDADRLRTLRGIKSAFMLLQTSEKADSLTEDDYIKAIQKLAKQRKDSLEVYEQQGREDLASVERAELEIIETFLPAQMSAEEIKSVVAGIIAEMGVSGPAAMGKVMPVAMQALSGKADGKLISQFVKELLTA